MSTSIAPPPPELAPSETQAEAPMVARIAGAVGLFILTAGVVSVIAAQYGRGIVGEPLGYLFGCFGVFLLLLHAASDSDIEVRRLYGGLAFLLLLGAIGVSLYPHKEAGFAEGKIGSLMLPYGGVLGLLSLLFFIPFSRQETDPVLHTLCASVLAGVGLFLTAGTVLAGIFWPEFLLGPGAVGAALGVGFLACFFSLPEPTEDLLSKSSTILSAVPMRSMIVIGIVSLVLLGVGPTLVFALGFLLAARRGLMPWILAGLGAVALLYALGRAVGPSVLHEGPNALKNAAREYDSWKVAARGLAIVIGAGIAYGASRQFAEIWRQGAPRAAGTDDSGNFARYLANLTAWSLVVLTGLAVIGIFVTGSFSDPVHALPAPYLVPNGIVLGLIGIIFLAVAIGIGSDAQIVVLTRREIASYFFSPIAYIVLICMVLFAVLGFALFLSTIGAGDPLASPMTEPIVGHYMSFGILGAFQAVFLVPALTMRLFSEEKRTGTLEVMLTAPVHDVYIVLSKFFAAWIFFMLCWIPAGLYLIGLRAAGDPFDYRPLLSFYLALGCCGAAFVAMGIFFSSVTNNQLIAAVMTFAGMMIQLLSVLAPQFKVLPEELQVAISKVDFLSLWQHSLAGQLSVQAIVVQLSLSVFWLVLTAKVLEARKWN